MISAKDARDAANKISARNASFEYRYGQKLLEIEQLIQATVDKGLRGFAVYVNSEMIDSIIDALKTNGYKCVYCIDNHALTIYFG